MIASKKVTRKMLETMMDTLPLQITVVDDKDKIVGWNDPKGQVFKRDKSILGKDVHDCHPPWAKPLMAKVLGELKSGKIEKREFWVNVGKSKVWNVYYALKDESGKYMGVMETNLNIDAIRSRKFGKKTKQDDYHGKTK